MSVRPASSPKVSLSGVGVFGNLFLLLLFLSFFSLFVFNLRRWIYFYTDWVEGGWAGREKPVRERRQLGIEPATWVPVP